MSKAFVAKVNKSARKKGLKGAARAKYIAVVKRRVGYRYAQKKKRGGK